MGSKPRLWDWPSLKTAAKFFEWLGFDEKRCNACGMPFPISAASASHLYSRDFCPACQKLFERYSGPFCHRCGLPAIASMETKANGRLLPGLCAVCSHRSRPWDSIAFYGLYAGQLRDLILRLKFGSALYLARVLAGFLYEASACLPKPDVIIAIPQYPSHLRKRGYNQAQELASELAAISGFAAPTDLLFRIKPGAAQEALNAKQRRLNLRSAFQASPKARGLAIWLIDDVFTTGSTCEAATLALKNAGAKAVYLLFVARTPLEQF